MSTTRSDRERLRQSFMALDSTTRVCPPLDVQNLSSSPPRYPSVQGPKPMPGHTLPFRSGSMTNIRHNPEQSTLNMRILPSKTTPVSRSCLPVDIQNLSSSPPRYHRSGSLTNLGYNPEHYTLNVRSNVLPTNPDLERKLADVTADREYYRKENENLRQHIIELKQARPPDGGVPTVSENFGKPSKKRIPWRSSRSEQRCHNVSCIQERRELLQQLAAERSKNEQKRNEEFALLQEMNRKMDNMPQLCAERFQEYSDLRLLSEIHRHVTSGIPNSVQQVASALHHITSTMEEVKKEVGKVYLSVHDAKGVALGTKLDDISIQIEATRSTCTKVSTAIGPLMHGSITTTLVQILSEMSTTIVPTLNQLRDAAGPGPMSTSVVAELHRVGQQTKQIYGICHGLSEAVGEQGECKGVFVLLQSISEMAGQILQFMNVCSDYKERLHKETTKCSSLKRKADQFQSNLQEQSTKLEVSEHNVFELHQHLDESKAELKRVQDQKSKLEEECIGLKEQLQSLKNTLTRKQEMMPATTRDATPVVQDQKSKLEEECIALKEELQRVQDQKSKLEEECSGLRERLQRKKNPPDIQREGHDALLLEYEAITSDLDGLLGELENTLGPYEAKQLMCQLFQTSFNKSKGLALQVARNQLGKLFEIRTPERECRDAHLESTSYLYDKLICASSIKANETTEATYITMVTSEVCEAFLGRDLYEKVKDVLIPNGKVGKEFRKLATIAWKFATISPPLIVCQPEKFNEKLIDKEATHWNKDLKTFSLVYTRPVVYRSYHGMPGVQGWAGNAQIQTCVDRPEPHRSRR